MKKTVKYILPLVCVLAFISCEKQYKIFEGETQVAFALATYTFNVNSATNSVTIPVQLITNKPQGAVNANITVDPATTCPANAVTVPTSVTIDAGRFTTNLVITVNHANLNAGNANRLILDLKSDIKVAGNYGRVTITLNRQ